MPPASAEGADPPVGKAPWRVLVGFALRADERAALQATDPPFELDEWPHATLMPSAVMRAALRTGFDAVLLTTSMPFGPAELAAAAPRLRLVATASAGTDHIDVGACAVARVAVTSAGAPLAETVADTAVGLALCAARRLAHGAGLLAAGGVHGWTRDLVGVDVHGSVVGIVGFGAVGRAVGRRLRAFGCTLVYAGPKRKADAEATECAEYVGMDALFRRADVVVLSCALNEATRGLVDAERLALMKRSAVLVNVARGDVVVQDALVEALERRDIFAAGLDVTSPEPLPVGHALLRSPYCFVTPHIASSTERAIGACVRHAIDNVVAAWQGRALLSPVKGSVAVRAE